MVNRARVLLMLTSLVAIGGVSQTAFAQEMAESQPVLDAAYAPSQPQYGGAFRFRYVSVPSWFLDLFAKENTPLSSYHTGFEFQRRKEDLDTIVDVSKRGAGTTICAFYDGAVGPYVSYIEKFREEFEALIPRDNEPACPS